MKLICYLLVAALFSVGISASTNPEDDLDVIFQISTIDALLEGLYDGDLSFQELKEKGDLGIGTFNGLDGEMIGFDGDFYQIKIDGVAYPVEGSMKTPFSTVTFFEADDLKVISDDLDFEQLQQYLDGLLPTENVFYAFKIEGDFQHIKTRSVPRQEKPYPKLVDVVSTKSAFFEFENVTGTIVGFRCPDYVDGVNVPGYHFHFITEDRTKGGHLLECLVQNVTVGIDYSAEFFMVLPENQEFYDLDLGGDKGEELEKVEK